MSFRKDIKISYVHDNSRERALARKTDTVIQCLIYVIVVGCFLSAATTAFQDLFLNFSPEHVQVNMIAIILLLLPFVLAMKFADNMENNAQKLLVKIGVCAVYIVGTSIFISSKSDEFLSGFGRIRWYACSAINGYYKVNLYADEGNAKYCGFALSVCFFVLLLITLFFALLIETRMLLIIIPVLSYVLCMCVGYAPKLFSVLSFMSGILLACSNSWERYQTAWGREKSKRKLKSFVFTLVFAMVAPLCSMLLLRNKSEKIVDNVAPRLKEIQRELDENLRNRYEKKIQEIAENYEGQQRESITNRKPIYDEEKMFTVEISHRPERNLYLREFYGVDYSYGAWESRISDTVKFEKQHNLAEGEVTNWIRVSLQEKTGDYIQAFGGYFEKIKGEIEYDSKTKYVQIPDIYGIDGGRINYAGEYLGTRTKSDESIDFSGYNVSLEYVQENPQYSEMSVSDMYDWYNEYAVKQYTAGCEKVPTAKSIADKLNIELRGYVTGIDGGAYQANSYRIMAAKRVSSYLSTATYNLELSGGVGIKDKVEYFLSTSHEGFCIHFASAATLILQNMGVPARYASGYVATASSFKKEGGAYRLDILDSDAHAWTEIYLDNIGWIPVEMTTGYGGGPEAGEGNDLITIIDDPITNTDVKTEDKHPESENKEDNDTESSSDEGNTTAEDSTENITSENKTSENKTSEDKHTGDKDVQDEDSPNSESTSEKSDSSSGVSEQEDSESDMTEAEDEGKSGESKFKVDGKIPIVVGIAVILALFGFLGRKYKHSERKIRKYIGKDNRKALSLVNENIARMLKRRKHLLKSGYSDAEIEGMLIEALREVSSKRWRDYVRIVQKARFSNHEISVEDIEFCMSLCYTNQTKSNKG